jgi:hypothetical protein
MCVNEDLEVISMRSNVIIGICILLALVSVVSAAGVTVSVADSSIGTGGKADIPVTVSGADRMGGMDMTITYDPAVLKFTGVKPGDLTKNGLIEANETRPGTINIGFINIDGISGDGNLFTVGFTAVGQSGTSSPVKLTNRKAFRIDLLDVPLTLKSGTITIAEKKTAPIGTEVIICAISFAVLFMAVYRRRG